MEEAAIKKRFNLLKPFLDERLRRILAATEASALGYGGVSLVARTIGVSRRAITSAQKELWNPHFTDNAQRIRRKGGGRKRSTDKDPSLVKDIEYLVEPVTRGDPESPLRWTCKSVRKISDELKNMGHKASYNLVAELLRQLDYSLQSNKKTLEGASHPDRDTQFEHINQTVIDFQSRHQPVISVDTKKKELIGEYKNSGREWRPKGDPEQVQVHDFGKKRVAPYGVYDLTQNAGWVSVGIDHDTATFAVESIRRWWYLMGQACYPKAVELLIIADGGGRNGYRIKLWKLELQKLVDEIGLSISVCHLPPGTSKWNKIEHRLFSFITQNWRGKPLVSHEVVVNLIAATTNKKGLKIQCQLDTNAYPKGQKISDKVMATLNIQRHPFHGEWNYTICQKNM